MPADTLTYTLTPSVRDVMLSGTAITPEIRIPLPQGLTEPVLDSGQWTMEVQDGAGARNWCSARPLPMARPRRRWG